ncbi:MAG: DUF4294 domain-containing protein [Pseudopedobacter saltans]|uniref:DUF4294 domain-containing protein n=1 Tax=Pseudopedobacter saltans TaxID=151895 RepID=A0A2W5F6H8_9SPHI|nr:MAG: DUF4294 domain-containing protein [Pseudopedobacter saltans]
MINPILIKTWSFFVLLTLFHVAKSQTPAADTTVGIYIDPVTHDTLPCATLKAVVVEGTVLPSMKKHMKEWTRLRNAVYVTYPYAQSASRVMNQINAELVGVTDKSKRKAIILSHEADLKKNFTSKVTNLSVYQGKVLMKLIKRQTGNNCYEIIKEYKGGFTATFWQGVAIVFGSSLKQDYEAEGEDQALEAIVQDVEKMYGYR